MSSPFHPPFHNDDTTSTQHQRHALPHPFTTIMTTTMSIRHRHNGNNNNNNMPSPTLSPPPPPPHALSLSLLSHHLSCPCPLPLPLLSPSHLHAVYTPAVSPPLTSTLVRSRSIQIVHASMAAHSPGALTRLFNPGLPEVALTSV
jgi:hypothetical protein